MLQVNSETIGASQYYGQYGQVCRNSVQCYEKYAKSVANSTNGSIYDAVTSAVHPSFYGDYEVECKHHCYILIT